MTLPLPRALAGAIVAAWLVLAVPAARADTITFSSLPGALGWFDHLGPAVVSGSRAIPPELLFDTALGTLEQVEIGYLGTASVARTLDVEPGSYSVIAWLDIQLTHAASGLAIAVRTILGSSAFTVDAAGPFTFSEGNSRSFALVASSPLDVFVTGGILELTASGLIDVYGPAGLLYSGLGDSLGGSSSIGHQLTYTYSPVPEPGSGMLAGLGLAWLAARQRRFRISSAR